jgi:hypothetical protein
MKTGLVILLMVTFCALGATEDEWKLAAGCVALAIANGVLFL